MNPRKLGELKEQFVTMKKQFRDAYGATLRVRMEIIENSLDEGFRMDIESTRKIYSIDPEDKYFPVYEAASPYSD